MIKLKKLAVVAGTSCVVLLTVTAGYKAFAQSTEEPTISEGIYIETLDVGGMTEEQAVKALDEYAADLSDKEVVVTVGDKETKTSLKDLGYKCKENDTVEEAMAYGKSGNFIKRYKDMKDLKNEPKVFELEFGLEMDKVTEFVADKCVKFEQKPVNAKLSRENGKFIVTESKTGIAVDADATAKAIVSAVEEDDIKNTEVKVEAVVTTKEPKYTSEQLKLCKDVLGTFSTTYASSSSSRANNLANGARLINGSIIWPGKTFSTSKTMSPITVANGYTIAGAYQNGVVVDSVGGGVCQVATTLYNAALLSELEIVERANHSMIVGYVKPSMDAAISGDYKDLKIKNNTDAPIYIEGHTEGRTITFTIYGHETRDTSKRTIEYESEVISTISPGGEVVKKDSSKPKTYRHVEQSAHIGYVARLWKIVYENGKQVSREKVNDSSYKAEPAHVVVGTKDTKPSPSPKKDNKKDNKKDTKKDNNNKKNDTKKTPAPAPTQAPAPDPTPDAPETPDNSEGTE
ncbi:MAG: VanW family protein [Lachnospiraceae bacterium]|nr:VanW family protein [Lachnospiraceae bacterium]